MSSTLGESYYGQASQNLARCFGGGHSFRPRSPVNTGLLARPGVATVVPREEKESPRVGMVAPLHTRRGFLFVSTRSELGRMICSAP